jgi:hypothetical protein
MMQHMADQQALALMVSKEADRQRELVLLRVQEKKSKLAKKRKNKLAKKTQPDQSQPPEQAPEQPLEQPRDQEQLQDQDQPQPHPQSQRQQPLPLLKKQPLSFSQRGKLSVPNMLAIPSNSFTRAPISSIQPLGETAPSDQPAAPESIPDLPGLAQASLLNFVDKERRAGAANDGNSADPAVAKFQPPSGYMEVLGPDGKGIQVCLTARMLDAGLSTGDHRSLKMAGLSWPQVRTQLEERLRGPLSGNRPRGSGVRDGSAPKFPLQSQRVGELRLDRVPERKIRKKRVLPVKRALVDSGPGMQPDGDSEADSQISRKHGALDPIPGSPGTTSFGNAMLPSLGPLRPLEGGADGRGEDDTTPLAAPAEELQPAAAVALAVRVKQKRSLAESLLLSFVGFFVEHRKGLCTLTVTLGFVLAIFGLIVSAGSA